MDQPHASHDLVWPFTGDFDAHAPERSSRAPTRGVIWVLRWAAAISALALSIVTLGEFAYCLAAERSLARAAQAATLEATLPRASYETVCGTAKRRLGHKPGLENAMNLSLLQNGVPVGRAFRLKPGDRIGVALSVPKSAVQPTWLQLAGYSSNDKPITVRAERDVPGKEFPASMTRRLWFAR